MSDFIADSFPLLASKLPKVHLANLPTPVSLRPLSTSNGEVTVAIKHDDLTGDLYGGNKVRKLEYLLARALDRGAKRVATFGTVGSNHALATALYASSLNLPCSCLLMHQGPSPNCAVALNMHLRNGSEVIRFGGSRQEQVATMRQHLQGRNTWVIPAGGSNWLGALGFVNAGLELADQVTRGELPAPDHLYVANGTMGTAAGLALGLALAGLGTEVQAVRVTYEFVANRAAMRRLVEKTAKLMRRFDAAVPDDLAERTRLRFRDDFFAGGYAQTNEVTDKAVASAREQLDLSLESTYTGKAMAALLHDLGQPEFAGKSLLFWNTYNSRPLPVTDERPADTTRLPGEFLRYYG